MRIFIFGFIFCRQYTRVDARTPSLLPLPASPSPSPIVRGAGDIASVENPRSKAPEQNGIIIIIIIIIIATQGRVVYGERRHAEPPGGNDHPQLSQRLG